MSGCQLPPEKGAGQRLFRLPFRMSEGQMYEAIRTDLSVMLAPCQAPEPPMLLMPLSGPHDHSGSSEKLAELNAACCSKKGRIRTFIEKAFLGQASPGMMCEDPAGGSVSTDET